MLLVATARRWLPSSPSPSRVSGVEWRPTDRLCDICAECLRRDDVCHVDLDGSALSICQQCYTVCRSGLTHQHICVLCQYVLLIPTSAPATLEGPCVLRRGTRPSTVMRFPFAGTLHTRCCASCFDHVLAHPLDPMIVCCALCECSYEHGANLVCNYCSTVLCQPCQSSKWHDCGNYIVRQSSVPGARLARACQCCGTGCDIPGNPSNTPVPGVMCEVERLCLHIDRLQFPPWADADSTQVVGIAAKPFPRPGRDALVIKSLFAPGVAFLCRMCATTKHSRRCALCCRVCLRRSTVACTVDAILSGDPSRYEHVVMPASNGLCSGCRNFLAESWCEGWFPLIVKCLACRCTMASFDEFVCVDGTLYCNDCNPRRGNSADAAPFADLGSFVS